MSDRFTHGTRSGPRPPAPVTARATARSRRSGFAAEADTKITKATKITNHQWVFVIFVTFVIFVPERVSSVVSAQAPQPAQSASAETPREAALTILERANRPFVPYVAVAGRKLTVVAELSAASIQAGRWKDGADVDVKAMGPGDEPIAAAKARLEPGTFSVAVPLTVGAAWPTRVTIALRAGADRPVEDWVRLEPPSGTLVGQAVAYRSGSRTAPRPVAAFEFARNERIRLEWPLLAAVDRREVRLLDRSGKPLPVELPLSEDPANKVLVTDTSVSGLPRADYLIELTVGSGATIERRLLAIRIKP